MIMQQCMYELVYLLYFIFAYVCIKLYSKQIIALDNQQVYPILKPICQRFLKTRDSEIPYKAHAFL